MVLSVGWVGPQNLVHLRKLGYTANAKIIYLEYK